MLWLFVVAFRIFFFPCLNLLNPFLAFFLFNGRNKAIKDLL